MQQAAANTASQHSTNKSTSISASLSSNPGSSAGIGGDSNQASSTTQSAISGIAGNKAARTGDAQTGITPIFDANQVQQEINAQTQITKEFGAQASRAIGDYAQSQLQAAQQQQSTGQSLQQKANQAKSEGRSQEAQVLQAQANEAMAAANELRQQWGEYGSRRIILHTLIGGLTGNAPGAVGAAAGTLTAPTVANALNNTNVPKPLANAITGLAATLVGGATGGAPGAAGALNEVTENFLGHADLTRLLELRNKNYEKMSTREKRELIALEQDDQQSDYLLGKYRRNQLTPEEQIRFQSYLNRYAEQNGGSAANNLMSQPPATANLGTGPNYSYPFALGGYQSDYDQQASAAGLGRPILRPLPSTSNETWASWLTNPLVSRPEEENRYHQAVSEQGAQSARNNSYHWQQAQSLRDGLGLTGAAITLSSGNPMVIGGALGGGFYVLGNTVRNEPIRPGELLINIATGAAGAPLASSSILLNTLLGGAIGATNTAATNWVYGEDESVAMAGGKGILFGALGTSGGKFVARRLEAILPTHIGGHPWDRSMPVLLQNIGQRNPYPGYIGYATEQLISNTPSFLPDGKK